MGIRTCGFNRGTWQILEGITRLWAAEHKTVHIISGSIFDRDGDGVRDDDAAAQCMHSNNGKERVAVPSAFYKFIVYVGDDGILTTLTLTRTTANPNGAAALEYLQDHVSSVAALERVTGEHFFSNGPAMVESTRVWPFTGKQPSSLCHAK